MKQRCTNPNNASYDRYGGRGIKFCRRWKKFENFLADMGEKPGKGWAIDRIDPDGDYKRSNCRWVTARDNTRKMLLARHRLRIEQIEHDIRLLFRGGPN